MKIRKVTHEKQHLHGKDWESLSSVCEEGNRIANTKHIRVGSHYCTECALFWFQFMGFVICHKNKIKPKIKHKWQKLENGEINDFAISEGYCNGPVCVECGHSFCEHCRPEEWDSDCPGRQGFQIYRDNKTYNWHGRLFGIRWHDKCLYVGIWLVTICFDFSGLFPYCEEIYKP